MPEPELDAPGVNNNMDLPPHMESRLARNEQQVQDLRESFKTHEQYVHGQFASFDTKLNSLETLQRQTSAAIIEKINAQQVENQSRGRMQPAIVIGICSLVFTVIMAVGAWAMHQQQQNAVTAAVTEERYQSQQVVNQNVRDWNRRIVDRQFVFIDEFEQTRAKIADVNASLIKTQAYQDYIRLQQDQRFDAIHGNIAKVSQIDAEIKHIIETLKILEPTIIKNQNQLGKLKPLVSDMGLQTIEGVAQRLLVLEDLVKAIDQNGTRNPKINGE